MEENVLVDIIPIIQILVTIIVAFITAILTNYNERKKQTTVFFKQEGIKIQQEMLDFWCSILFNDYENTMKKYIRDNSERIMSDNNLVKIDEITDTMAIKIIHKDSYMYSSNATLKYIGKYMQEVYKDRDKPRKMEQMFLVSKIIVNMKNDFTGEKTSVINLLQIKINDLDIKKKIKIYGYELKHLL